ncbi:MAG: hypothetical protein ABIX01_15040 [Chitinophagaceae bacterium]
MKTCKLCLQKKPLIKKSHIIPDFMYKEMFDENHKLIVQPFRQGTVEKYEIKRPSDGEYEGGLLCDDCDNNLLGHFENYSSKALYGGKLRENECPIFQNCISQHGIGFIKCERLNYHKYKLFLLSILWRASISTRPFFSEIILTSEHEEEIRNMMLTKDGGDVAKYPIFVSSYANNHDLPKQLIAQPIQLSSTDDLQVYSFMINGYFYIFYINKPKAVLPHYVTAETIKPNNELNIIIIPEGNGLNFIFGQFGLRP